MKKRALTLTLASLSVASLQANRMVQIREVNLETGVIELRNFDSVAVSLNGWRFCSHDENEERRYSSAAGLNGITLQPDESLFVHYLNDAPAGDDSAINIAGRGNFAQPLDSGAYAIQIYINSSFGSASSIADHLQWSIDGIDNDRADRRSSIAQSGGTWTDQNLWINTTAESQVITLTDESGAALHGPDNFLVTEPELFPEVLDITDIAVAANGDVTLAWDDLSRFGSIDYTIESSSSLEPDSWEPLFPAPLQENSVIIPNPSEETQFFRVLASPTS